MVSHVGNAFHAYILYYFSMYTYMWKIVYCINIPQPRSRDFIEDMIKSWLKTASSNEKTLNHEHFADERYLTSIFLKP